jgi:hypothetical protein
MNEEENKFRKGISALFYLVVLILGIIAAYQHDWIVSTFWAIVFASENIAISIDKLRKKP